MNSEKSFDYKGESVLFKKGSCRVLGMDKIQNAIESIEDVKEEVNVSLTLNELINIRRLLILDTIQMDLLRDGIIEKTTIHKVNKLKSR